MRPRRHPADVTADRLAEHYEAWFAKLDGSEKDAICSTVGVLREIAAGER